MNLRILTLGLFLLTGFLACNNKANTTNTTLREDRPGGHLDRPSGPPTMAQLAQRVDQLSAEMGLSENQKSQLLEIEKQFLKQIQTFRKERVPHQMMHQKMQSLEQRKREKLTQLLTPSQVTKYESLMRPNGPGRQHPGISKIETVPKALLGQKVSQEVPAIYQRFTENVEVFTQGDYLIIKSNGVPDHSSPYFSRNEDLYEAYNGSNHSFRLNPNRIIEQDYTFRIPLNPEEAKVKSPTPLGPIGVSLNGVPFFNQYAGPNNQPLTREINSFDQYNGHPQQMGAYHYHIEPLYLTKEFGKDALLGYLLDGFPVYGPKGNGKTVLNKDLDDYHGHFHATKEYPEGIYHYHITSEDPYINGNGFFGKTGYLTQ